MENLTKTPSGTQSRLYSLDVFRGLTMVWMFGNGFGLQYFRDHPVLGLFARQFTHADWEGMHPWDLIQPFFMFIVGVAMPFSFEARRARGDVAGIGWGRVLKRSALLLLCGLLARSIQNHGPTLDLINVLGQLAFTYIFAYAVLGSGWRVQAAAAFGLLALHTILFLQFDPAWERDTNFGAWLDRAVLGKNWRNGYATINFLSSGANTIFGVMAGWLLIDKSRSAADKIRVLCMWAAAGIVAGRALSLWIPLIKKIWTASFAVYSTGYTLLALAFFYWLLDVRRTYPKPEGWSKIFAIVGANSIFIYMFHEALYGFVLQAGHALLGDANRTADVPWMLFEWTFIAVELLACWWLWRRRIFLKL